MEGCTKRAKLKVSTANGWVKRWCFKHSAFMLRPMLKQCFRYNGGLYIQKDPDA